MKIALARSLLTSILATTAISSVSSFSTTGSRVTTSFVRHNAVLSSLNRNNENGNGFGNRSFTSTSLNMANVLKLTDPHDDLLKDIDVFIFDCDGVIWRVS